MYFFLFFCFSKPPQGQWVTRWEFAGKGGGPLGAQTCPGYWFPRWVKGLGPGQGVALVSTCPFEGFLPQAGFIVFPLWVLSLFPGVSACRLLGLGSSLGGVALPGSYTLGNLHECTHTYIGTLHIHINIHRYIH